VKYFKDPDRMYFISPLLFWACAEMTCGFFILSMPYLPRIIAGSRLPRKVKVVLGLSVQPTNRSNHDNFEPCRGSHGKSRSTVTSNSLFKIRKSGIPMSDLERSESQEHLRGGTNVVRVTRTTNTSFVLSPHYGTDSQDNIVP
ncbi:unnamed protein product, partial [Clonostachys chloroleuca]